ncbi:helix-turn-helix domain-containing protein, partial [Chryseobacterium sp.]|uniref:helix-turn-helix domain-containing protein n=1 Tax=Chryseobacterium sp. TaxID=1871047 RepID=UPI00321AB167
LPPVVRDDSERILSKYYETPFFFSAKALQNVRILTVELTIVYRQQDEEFLEILDAVRHADFHELDFEKLNSRYNPDFEPENETYIHLCSHNRMADHINQKKLAELEGESLFYKASVIGEFKETQYPVDETLELKVGAQIMFIRNDSSPEKNFYNGKLAEISYLDEDVIKAVLDESKKEIIVTPEVWEQKRYTLDADKIIKTEVLGSFEQYPIRLAWAVTIHKSQGLTFDRVIIDAGRSFASGQVYVALSRCRTLNGIVLKSEISQNAIFKDHRIEDFQDSTNANDNLVQIIEHEKYDYTLHKVQMTVDAGWLKEAVMNWKETIFASEIPDLKKVIILSDDFERESEHLFKVSEKFKKVIRLKLTDFIAGDIQWVELEEKSKGAVSFFYKNIAEKILLPLKNLYTETIGIKGLKKINEETKKLLQDLEEYIEKLKSTYLLEIPLFDKEIEIDTSVKVVKKPTHTITFELFDKGMPPFEIAEKRNLTLATVYRHLAKMGLTEVERTFKQ